MKPVLSIKNLFYKVKRSNFLENKERKARNGKYPGFENVGKIRYWIF